MSTKILNAYQLTHNYSMYELNQIIDKFRKEIKDICNRDILQSVIESTLYFYNFKQVYGDEMVAETVAHYDPKNKPDSNREVYNCWKAVQNDDWRAVFLNVYFGRIDDIRKDSDSPFSGICDYSSVLQIIPTKTKLLAMYFGNYKIQQYLVDQPDFLQDYHYQNMTDRPDDISESAWEKREQDWDEAIGPDYIPKQHGFAIELFDTNNVMGIFSPSKVKPVQLPDLQSQIRSVSHSASISHIEGYQEAQKYNRWLTFFDSEPYKKWFSDYTKMVQEKCKFITDFDEFCKLVES